MRKFMALAGMAAVLMITPEAPVLAQVIDPDELTCQGRVPDADGNLVGEIVFGTLHVRTNKTWTTMTCHFDLTEEQSPPKATHARGFTCSIPPYGSTTETRASASSGGRMVMTCRIPTPVT
jgi:hypothetical protein